MAGENTTGQEPCEISCPVTRCIQVFSPACHGQPFSRAVGLLSTRTIFFSVSLTLVGKAQAALMRIL
jgi:hypothetical protein